MSISYYREKQNEWINKNHVKIGDTVRVIRAAEDSENGWPSKWAAEMLYAVGKMGRIERISDYGVEVNISGISWAFRYPYFVLEKVDSEQQARAHKEWKVSYDLKVRTGDSVLVRDGDGEVWRYSLFSHVDRVKCRCKYVTTSTSWAYCVPYAGNEHLVGTSDEWEDPAAETKKENFRFGAKVRGREGDDAWEGLILDYDERDNSYQIACRNSEEKVTDIFWVDADEFTYID